MRPDTAEKISRNPGNVYTQTSYNSLVGETVTLSTDTASINVAKVALESNKIFLGQAFTLCCQ